MKQIYRKGQDTERAIQDTERAIQDTEKAIQDKKTANFLNYNHSYCDPVTQWETWRIAGITTNLQFLIPKSPIYQAIFNLFQTKWKSIYK